MEPEDKSSGLRAVEPETASRLRTLINVVLVLVVVFFALRGMFLRAAGRGLVQEDEPRQADLMVISGESPILEAMAGADYFKAGLAPKIFLSGVRTMEGAELAAELKLAPEEHPNIAYRILTGQGVPEPAIVQDAAPVPDLDEEARRVKTFLAGGQVKTLILVTPKYCAKRARAVFAEILGPEIEIISLPSKYDRFDPDHWWRDRDQAEKLLVEYFRLFARAAFSPG